jgi:RNA-directed DNA polymerase
LLAAWKEFVRGKRKKDDVQEFQYCLMGNILDLHRELKNKTYRHGGYHTFKITDPKPRDIHKATVRDRLLHHAIYRKLYPFFDRTFINDSYSCRKGKGTHRAMDRFRDFAYKVSKNHTRTCWVLKCDVRKFFASIYQPVLIEILRSYIPDEDVLALLGEVISSFHSTAPGYGLPLGNLTSQLLVNVYMNKFDHFAKHMLKARYYVRYADDFVILDASRQYLEDLLPHVEEFLSMSLHLALHPDKVFINTFASGLDFLG